MKCKEYDWASAIYELASNQSDEIVDMLKSADLDPKTGDLAGVDLSKLNLSNQDMSGWDLSGVNLEDTVLRGANLIGVKIEARALLKAKNWREAHLDEYLRNELNKLSNEFSLEFNAILLKKIHKIEFSVRTKACLKNSNIIYVGDLIQLTEAELLRTPNFGRKSLSEVKEMLTDMGLALGMDLEGWPPKNIEELAKRYEDQY